MRLYEISRDIRQVLDFLDSGELTDEQTASLETLGLSFDSKVDSCCGLIREWESYIVVRESEIDRLKAGIDSYRNAIRRLKDYLKTNLETIGESKHETALFTIRTQANPPGCDCIEPDVTKLDPKYIRTKQEPDKTAALDEWKRTGTAPNGFEIRKGSHLRIK